jgi:hypothetical protein
MAENAELEKIKAALAARGLALEAPQGPPIDLGVTTLGPGTGPAPGTLQLPPVPIVGDPRVQLTPAQSAAFGGGSNVAPQVPAGTLMLRGDQLKAFGGGSNVAPRPEDASDYKFASAQAAGAGGGGGGGAAAPSPPPGPPQWQTDFDAAREAEGQALEDVGRAGAHKAEAVTMGHELAGQMLGQQVEDAKASGARRTKELQGIEARYSKFADDAAKMHINPERWMDSRGFFGKALLALGAALNGFAVGTGHAHQNATLNLIDSMVDRDIASQKHEIEQAHGRANEELNLLSMARARFGDEEKAEAATRALIYQQLGEQTSALTAGTDSESLLANAALARAQLEERAVGEGQKLQGEALMNALREEELKKAQMRAMGGGGGGGGGLSKKDAAHQARVAAAADRLQRALAHEESISAADWREKSAAISEVTLAKIGLEAADSGTSPSKTVERITTEQTHPLAMPKILPGWLGGGSKEIRQQIRQQVEDTLRRNGLEGGAVGGGGVGTPVGKPRE